MRRLTETIRKINSLREVFKATTRGVDPADEITRMDAVEFAIDYNGADIMKRLIDLEIIRDTEYDEVEFYYRSGSKYLILGFVYEELGYEQVQFGKVELRVIDPDLLNYLDDKLQ